MGSVRRGPDVGRMGLDKGVGWAGIEAGSGRVGSGWATTRSESGTDGLVAVALDIETVRYDGPNPSIGLDGVDGLFAFHGMLFVRVWPRACHLFSAPRQT